MDTGNRSPDATPQEPDKPIEEYVSEGAIASPETSPAHAVDNLIVIGLGASAGGLLALRSFFAAMPHDTGMTFVVVVHLSPEHESILAELLQGYTVMSVRQVQAQVKMEPNCVYVIPPGKRLVVNDRHLDLTDFDMPRGPRLQIDTFFRSLAEEHGDGAAIILSGTGSDGAVGIQAIKDSGGLILVQSPDEAEYDGMPKSAIATGLVDIVAPVEELAVQLVAAKRTRAALKVPTDPEELSNVAQQTLAQLMTQLRMRTGHDFSGYKQTTILRRVTRRMQLVQLDTLSAYLNRLRQDGDEADALYRDLLIHVTEFFRDAASWRYLEEQIVPRLFAGKRAEDHVRVWTVGCATGEEAYGIAMLLLEYAATLDAPPHIQIFASDLGRLVLDFAREGAYPEAIAADVSEERLRRFFVKDNSHYRVRTEVRERVLFAPHNLLQDPPFSKLDLILCRNLLIYLQRPVQARVFDAFFYALHPQGFLFLGSAESTDGVTELFDIVNKQHRVYQRGQRHIDTMILPALSPSLRAYTGQTMDEMAVPAPQTPNEAPRLLLEELGVPTLLVDANYQVLHYSESVGRYLHHPAGRPTLDVTRLVRAELQTELRLALTRAFAQKQSTRTHAVPVQFNGGLHPVTILVRPTPQRTQLLLIFLEDEDISVGLPEMARSSDHERDGELLVELQLTQQRLQTTREEYETTVEELRAANEELQSTNEEYRSTLEELETSKEELQSINEELQSVNQEMRSRVDEVTQANSDLQNLFAATEIATLFLDRDLLVKRYTPRAAQLFNLMPPDRGRPISHLRTNLVYATLETDARQVLATLIPIEHEVESDNGYWFLLSVRPYRTTDDKIDGVVITCVDISESKHAEQSLREAKEYAESIIQTIPDALLVLSSDLRVQSVNDAFYTIFQVEADETLGRLIYELGNGEWDIPELRILMEDILPENHLIMDYEVDHTFEKIGRRIMLVNGRQLAHIQLILLSITDISKRKEAEEALRQSEERLRKMVNIEGVGVLLFDKAGNLVTANDAFLTMVGYSQEEVESAAQIWRTTTVPEYMTISAQQLRQIEETGRIGPYEKEYLNKDGSPSWMVFAGASLGDGTIVEYCIDVSDRKQAEEALRRLTEELEATVRMRTAQVSNLVTQLTMSEQEERRRISSILHDDLQQRLFSLLFQLQLLQGLVINDTEAARSSIAEIEEDLQQSVQITRELSVDLSPPVLHNEGLVEAVRWLANRMKQQYNLEVSVHADEALPLPNVDLRVLLFQIVRELLFNVVKHAEVHVAKVVLAHQDGHVRIEVSDEGQGFSIYNDERLGMNSQGLQRIKQRLQLLGGSMEIISSPGQGTRITVDSPLQRSEGKEG